MRDLIVFLFVMLMLPVSFRRPFVGLLLFSWLAYMRPQDLCWGFARTMRLSFFVAMAMIAGWWAGEMGRRAFARWDLRSTLMVVLAFLVAMSYAQAKFQDEYVTRYFFEFVKIIVIALFTSGQVDTRQRFRVMVWVIAMCLAFYGVKGGVFGLLTGGATILRGPGGMLEDNNDFALALVMNVPLLWYLGNSEAGTMRLIKPASRVGILLTVITVLLTHSRGAFLALTATALWIAWRSRKLFRAGIALGLCGVAFLLFAPQSVLDRLSTISDTKESSANARLTAWRIAFRMIEDNPFFGVGLRNFQPRYRDYAEVARIDVHKTYVAHNSYLQIWAESGSLAFLVYMLLLGSVFWTCRRVYRMGLVRLDMRWAMDYARMMEATTVGFMVGAVFLNRGHFDLIYHWLALVTCLGTVAAVAWARGPAAATAGGAGAPHRGRARVAIRRRPVFAASSTTASGKLQPRWGRAY
ncbi:MAG: putative O-glycosylation ligase, exosortase A system-associated [Planctomycetota bacterium]